MLGKTENTNDGASSASIKSGVIGFPQGSVQHAAPDHHHGERGIGSNTIQSGYSQKDSSLPDRTAHGHRQDSSHFGRDSTVGSGMTAAKAVPAQSLHCQNDHDNLRAPEQSTTRATDQTTGYSTTRHSTEPFERSFGEPVVTTDTDRSFPLAGGVTSRKQVEHPSSTHNLQPSPLAANGGRTETSAAQDFHSSPLATNERELGTKDRNFGVSDGHHGREGLAGAAAAAAVVGGVSSHSHSDRANWDADLESATGRAGEAPATSNNVLRSEHEQCSALPQGEHSQGTQSQIAFAGSPGAAAKAVRHDENKQVQYSPGDPCASDDKPSTTMFTSGPHKTDTANRIDPHIHVPGEFPETPLETPNERTLEAGGYPLGINNQPEKGLTTSSTPASNYPEVAQSEHHHDKLNTGIGALGMGAAGIGAHEAWKRHENESTEGSGAAMPMESSPYSSKKVDPRVDSKPSTLDHQHLSTTAETKQPHGLDSSHSPKSHHDNTQHTVQALDQPHSEDHNYGHDAGLIGTGVATAGGLYYANQHGDRPDSGPASSTIGPHKSNDTNVFDPRVQPDPALQKHHHAGSTLEDPATKTVGPHKSNIANIVDPRVLPEPQKQKGHTMTGPHQSDTLDRLDPKVNAHQGTNDHDGLRRAPPTASFEDQRYGLLASEGQSSGQNTDHHYDRDAALGAGAAGTGALSYGALKNRDGNSQPLTSQQYGTSQTSQLGGSQHQLSTSQNTQLPTGQQNPPHEYDPFRPSERNHARDVGLGATGAGVAGAALYATSKHHDADGPQTREQGLQQSNTHQRYDSAVEPSQQRQVQEQQHHHGKQAAMAGGAAGVSGVGAGYAYSQHDAKEEKQRLAEQKAYEKQQEHLAKERQKEVERKERAQAKEMEHAQKEQKKEQQKALEKEQKAFEHHQKELEKQQRKEQKHHDKLAAAAVPAASAASAPHRETEAQQPIDQTRPNEYVATQNQNQEPSHVFGGKRSDEAERPEDHNDEGKGKKHHLFGFLHKDKKQSPERDSRASTEHVRPSPVDEARIEGVNEGFRRMRNSSHGSHEGRNKLHKDPPKGHPAWELQHQMQEQQHEPSTGNHDVDHFVDRPL